MRRARIGTRPPKPMARRRVSALALAVVLLAGAPAGLLAGRPPRLLRGHADDVYALAFSPGGVLASVSGDGTARLWDPATGRGRAALEGHDGLVYGAAFSPDGKALTTAGGDAAVPPGGTATQTVLVGFESPAA